MKRFLGFCGLVVLTVGIVISLPHLHAQELSEAAQAEITTAVYLNQQAYDQYRNGDAEGAIATYQDAIALFRAHDAYAGMGNSFNGIGEVYLARREPDNALKAFQSALTLFERDQNLLYQGYTYQYLGEAYNDLQNRDRALDAYQAALDRFQPLQQEPNQDISALQTSEIYTRTAIAALHFQAGHYPPALQEYQTVLALQTARTDKIGSAYTLNNIGVVHANANRPAAAFNAYQDALAIIHELAEAGVRYLGEEAAILNNLSTLFFSLGQAADALETAQQAYQLHQTWLSQTDDTPPPLELDLLRDTLGQSLLSPVIVHQELAVRAPLGRTIPTDQQQAGQGLTLLNLGRMYQREGDLNTALTLFQEAEGIFKTLGNEAAWALTVGSVAQVYGEQGESAAAIAQQTQALEYYRRTEDRAGLVVALSNLAHHSEQQGNGAAAAARYREVLALGEDGGNAIALAFAQRRLGQLMLQRGDLEEAIALLRQSIQTLAALQPGLKDASRVALFDQTRTAYQALQRAFIARQDPEAALVVAEQGRARAFLELLGERRAAAIETAPDLARIRTIARTTQSTLVEYSFIDDQTLYIWTVQPTGAIGFHSQTFTPVDANSDDRVSDIVVRTRNQVLGQRGDRIPTALTTLYDTLIAPIAAELPTDPDQVVAIIPQDTLFLVPFAALLDPTGQPLIAHHAITTAPSIQTLALLQTSSPAAPQAPLIVGNPTMPSLSFGVNQPAQTLTALPGTEMEAKAIATVLKTTPLLGNAATETAILHRLPTADIIHLATHGLLDELPLWSSLPGAIALAPDGQHDGLLTSRDILDQTLTADLVVLSACNTGRGQLTGDGVVGLARSFLGAGAQRLVVSLWAVPDQPTALLMTEFYRQWQGESHPAIALRHAMLTTRATYPAAKDWAGFTLVGMG